MELEHVRNIGVAAHIDAGKTTVSERILFVSGVEHKVGQVDEGTAVMDWMPEERERGITITSAATSFPWRGTHVNLIDTPGHVDFTVEVERCMRVLDGAILVIDAVAGVQAQSETVWRQMVRHRVPALVFVNKCDRAGADFLAAAASVRRRLGSPAVPIQYPLMVAGELRGVIDLVGRRAWTFDAERAQRERPGGEARAREVPIPSEQADEVNVLRAEMLDTLAEHDESLVAAVLEERDVGEDELRAALRRTTLARTVLPVLCGAALRDVGVQALLDAVVDYLPSPLDVPPVQGIDPRSGESAKRATSAEAPLAALAFKLHAEAHGDLVFLRVYSGRLDTHAALWNPRTRRHERVGRLMRVHADSRSTIPACSAGDIVAVTGLKGTVTGDTLCDPAHPILLEPPVFPEPVISLIVEPASTEDREKLRTALARMAHEDPTFHQREDESTGQWTVSGMGELHLEVAVHRLKSEFHVDARVGRPRVAYRETVRVGASGAARVERQVAGKDAFGAVELEVEALPSGGDAGLGLEVVVEPACGVPVAFHAGLRAALLEALASGPRFGFPLSGVRVRVIGGESQPRFDHEVAFVGAGLAALRRALDASQVDLLEPLMAFEIQAPPEFTSGIIADLNARHAEVGGVDASATERVLRGTVPLSQMFGYSTAVRSLSQGRAGFSMLPAGYRAVPEAELEARGLTWG